MSSPLVRNLRPFRRQIPLQGRSPERRLPLRRARDASRTKLSRKAVRGSGRSAGEVDESAPGSANPWSRPCRAHKALRKYVRLVKKSSQRAENRIARRLTGSPRGSSLLSAPRTERLRLMALRQAAASAAVSRRAGRRSTGLGAFCVELSSQSSRRRGIMSSIRDCRNLRQSRSVIFLTGTKSASRFPSAPSTERRRTKALPPGSRFGEGRSGELDGGDTDSVHFLWSRTSRCPTEVGHRGTVQAARG
jgi:hypothetical protein